MTATRSTPGAMSRLSKAAALIALALILGLLAGQHFSPEFRRKMNRIAARAEMRISALRGYPPQPLDLLGRVSGSKAEIHALESKSGWAAQSDIEGRFELADLVWYRGATYELLIQRPGATDKLIRVSAPNQFPEGGVFDVGEVDMRAGEEVAGGDVPGLNSTTLQQYDEANSQYYEDLFHRLTAGKQSHEERILAINDHVTARLNYESTQMELGSPRRVLESGSQYCGHLANTMATLLTAGQYEVRQIDMTDGNNPARTHVVVEVLYDSDWRLFDPTYGVVYRRDDGSVASYSDVRLNLELISVELFSHLSPRVQRDVFDLMRVTYGSGLHHYYRFRK